MRMAVTTAASTSSDISGLADQLVQKEIDYNELQALFTKYKLKQKVKYDKLRDEVLAYIKKTATSSDKENNALLMIRVSETEAKLEEAERRNEALNRELQRRQTQINDQTILLKNLEDQVRARRPMTEMERSERRRMNELVDMESVHAQMTYKDERIIELNNVILDKERQILDLQELVREHDEVASSKKQAMRLVQKRFEELDSKTHRTIGTETDFSLLNGSPSHARSRHEGASTSFSRAIRGTSPGRAVRGHQQSHGTSSPPPLDPSEDTLDDEDQPGTSNLVRRLMEEKRKKKLRVTFDLPASGSLESILHPPSEKRKEEEKIEAIEKAVDPVNHEERQREIDEFASAVQALTTENERLRGVVDEQSTELVELRANASEADNEASRVQKENKSATAKARVVAQARIKDLEDKMAELNKSLSTQIESLQMENETLRSTREWEIEENAKMRQRLAKTLEKNNKLHGEVEASLVTNCELETRMLAEQEVMQRMMEDLEDAERIIVQQDDDKAQMAEDMELMRGAIIAQEQFIEVLEADIVIYEEHIGILRESLGASKVDHRDLIRSKAFEAKLRALEEEKQEIARTRHDERLKTKALNAKVRLLEGENEKLMAKICEMEMRSGNHHDEDEEHHLNGGNGEHQETLHSHPSTTQLQHQIHEAEFRLSSMRDEFDHQLASARLETENATRNAQYLRDTVDRLEGEMRNLRERERQSTSRSFMEEFNPQQTVLQADLLSQQELEALRERAGELETALRTAQRVREELADQLNHIGAENFELRERISVLQRDTEELTQLRLTNRQLYEALNQLPPQENERFVEEIQRLKAELEALAPRHHEICRQLADAHQQVATWQYRSEQAENQLLMSQGSSVELVEPLQQSNQNYEEVNQLRKEVNSLKDELDHARLSLAETREVQKEVELLKAELEEERKQTEAKWDEVCEKLIKGAERPQQESPAGKASRKASLDEMHCYLDAYAEKCKRLEEELKETKGKIEHGSSSYESSRNASPELEAELAVCQQRIADLEKRLEDKSARIAQIEQDLQAAYEKIETDKLEKKKLKTAVKQLRDKQGTTVEKITAAQVEPTITISQVQQSSSHSVNELPVEQNLQELENRLQKAELESFENHRLLEDVRAELHRTRTIAQQKEWEFEEKIEQLEQEKKCESEQKASVEAQEQDLRIRSQQTIQDLETKVYGLQEELYGQSQAESMHEIESREKRITMEHQIQDLQNRLQFVEEAKVKAERDVNRLSAELETLREGNEEKERTFQEQISIMEEQQIELSFRAENAEESFNLSDLHETAKALQSKVDELRAELAIALTNLEAQQEENQRIRENGGDPELIERLQQEIRSLTFTLQKKDYELTSVQDRLTIAEQQAIVNEVVIETTNNGEEIEHESLLRATAATSNAVNSLLTTAPRSPLNTQENAQIDSQAQHHFPLVHHVAQMDQQNYWTQQQQQQPNHQPGFVSSDWPQAQQQQYYAYQSHSPQQHHHSQFPSVHQQEHQYYNHGQPPQILQVDPENQETPVLASTPVPTPRDNAEKSNFQSSPSFSVPVPQLNTNTEKDLFAENQLLRECVNETSRMHDSLGTDVERLQELRAELETAIEALQAEIWSLNGQLKASVLDRENLSDRVADLDSQLIVEKRRADQIDQELSEQVELTEKAQRQAAESENESNRRLAECLEMENRREELEKSYAQLMEYYTQLHASYNALYTSVNSAKQDGATETDLSTSDVTRGQEALRLYGEYRHQFTLIREQTTSLREAFRDFAQDLTRTDLTSLESSIGTELARIETASRRVNEIRQNLANPGTSHRDEEIGEVIDSLIQDCGLEISLEADLIAKVDEVATLLQSKIREIEETRKAVLQQQRICSALEDRLSKAEENSGPDGDTRQELAVTQMMLRQKNYEISELQARVEELKEAVTELSTSRENEQAARLATRQADVDSLFRANADLAHTNVRLQNEMDERREIRGDRDEQQDEIERLCEVETTLNTQLAALDRQILDDRRKVADLERQLEEARNRASIFETQLHTQQELLNNQQSPPVDEEMIDELARLRDVEKLLNQTINGFEEKLMEAEERIHELEIEIDEAKEKQGSTQVTKRDSNEGWGWGDEEEVNVERKEMPTLEQTPNQSETLQNELKEAEKKRSEAEEKAEWMEKEMEEMRGEYDGLVETITQLRVEQMEWRKKIEEMENELTRDRLEKEELQRRLEEGEQQKEEDGWGESWKEEKQDDQLAESLAVEKKQRADAEEQKELLKAKVQSLLEKIDCLENEFMEKIEAKDSIENELREKIETVEKEKMELEMKMDEGKGDAGWGDDEWKENNENDENGEKMAEAETQILTLRAELDAKEESLADTKKKAEILQSQLDQVERERQQLAEHLQQFENQKTDDGWGEEWNAGNEITTNAQLIDEKEQLQKEIGKLEKEIETLSKKLDETEGNYEEILEELRVEVTVLREKLEQSNNEIGALREQLERSEPEMAKDERNEEWGWGDDENGPTQTNAQITTLEARLEELSLKLTIAERQIEEKEMRFGEMKEDNEQMEIEMNELRTTIERISRELAEKMAQLEQVDGVQSEMDNLREELNRLKVERKEMEKNLEMLEAQKKPQEEEEWGWGDKEENGQGVNAELQTKIEELKAEVEIASRSIENLKLEIHQKETDAVEALELQETLQGEVNELLHQLQETKQELGKEKNERNELQQCLEHSKQQEDRLAKELTEQAEQSERNEIGEMEELRSQLKAAHKKCSLLMDSESRLLEQVDEYGAQADLQREEAERLQKVINQLEAQILDQEESREKIKEMEKKLEEQNDRSVESSAAQEQAKELEELKKKLQKKEEKIEVLIVGKQETEKRMGEAQKRLQAVEQERDTAKRLYDELRAKLLAAKRKAAATKTSQSSRRSSIASTSAPLEHEIPEEPTFVAQLTQHSPRFDSSVDSTTSQYPLDGALGELTVKFEAFLEELGEIFNIHHEYIDEIRTTFKTLTEKKTTESSGNGDEILERMIERQNLIDELGNEVDRLRDELKEKEIENLEFRAQTQNLDSLIKREKEKYTQLEEILNGKENEFRDETTRIHSELQEKMEELQDLQKLFEETRDLQRILENEREELKDERDALVVKNTELQLENGQLYKESEKKLQAEKVNFERDLQEKTVEMERLGELLEEAKAQQKTLEDEKDSMREEIETITIRVSEIDAKNERLREKLENSEKRATEEEDLAEVTQKIQQELVEAGEKAQRIEEENMQLKDLLQSVKDEEASQGEEMKEKERRLKEEMEKIQDESNRIIQDQKDEIDELKLNLERSRTALACQENKISQHKTESEEKDQKNQTLQNQLSVIREELEMERQRVTTNERSENEEARIEELQEKLHQAEQINETLETRISDIETINSSEIKQKEIQLQDLQSQFDESLSKIAFLEASLESISVESEALRSSSDLTGPQISALTFENETLKKDSEENKEKLKRIEAKIGDLQSKHLQSEKEKDEEIAKLGKEIEERKEETRNQREQIVTLSEDFARIQSDLREKVAQVLILESTAREGEGEIEKLQVQISYLLSEREMLTTELETSTISLQQQQKAEEAHGEQIELLNNEIQDLQQKLSEQTMELVESGRAKQEISLPLGGAANEEVQDLRSDCVRLESQLRTAHDRILDLQKEIFSQQQRVECRDRNIVDLRNELSSFRQQLQHLQFENEQLRRSMSNRDPAERIIAMEREVTEIKTRLQNRNDALMEDLRTTEQQLEIKSQREQEALKNAEKIAEVAEEWQLKCETAMQEMEALRRCAEETARLGNALERSRSDQMDLVRQLEESEQTAKRAQQEKDALHAQLTIVSQQLDDRTERLRKAAETKMHNVLRLVELESRLNASRLTVAEQRRCQNTPLEGEPDSSVEIGENDSPQPSREELIERLTAAEARIRELENPEIISSNPDDEAIEDDHEIEFLSASLLDRSLEDGNLVDGIETHLERESESGETQSQLDQNDEIDNDQELNPHKLRSPWCFNNPDF